jgi:uncharacterized membrane protein
MFLLVLLLLHLFGLAAYLGGGAAQQLFMRMSGRAGLSPVLRDEYERLSASLVTRVELPALFAQVVTGVAFIVAEPALLQQHWLHGKLTAVLVLLVLAHLEMFNARKLVKARAARGDAAADEIAARKSRHALLGGAGAVLVLAVMLLATVLRGTM